MSGGVEVFIMMAVVSVSLDSHDTQALLFGSLAKACMTFGFS